MQKANTYQGQIKNLQHGKVASTDFGKEFFCQYKSLFKGISGSCVNGKNVTQISFFS